MDVAYRLAASGAADGTVVVTGRQYRGRGQHNRHWHARGGEALLCSIILQRKAIEKERLQSIPLRAACAVQRMLQDRLGIAARIRWPNDILVGGQKVCGILSEYHGEVIIGVGLNCKQRRFPHQYDTPPTSLYLSGCGRWRRGNTEISPRTLLAPLVEALCHELTNNETDWHAHINTHLWRKGAITTISPLATADQQPFPALLVGVDEDGALCYTRTADSASRGDIERLYAGSIR